VQPSDESQPSWQARLSVDMELLQSGEPADIEQPTLLARWTLLEKVPLATDDPAYSELPTLSATLTISELPASPSDVSPGEPEPAV
jgi:hypothetical protein